MELNTSHVRTRVLKQLRADLLQQLFGAHTLGSPTADLFPTVVARSQESNQQADLHVQANRLTEEAFVLLEQLTPARSASDEGLMGARCTLIRTELHALTEEFGRVNGLRPERVTTYFTALRKDIAAIEALVATETPVFVQFQAVLLALQEAWDTFSGPEIAANSSSLSLTIDRASRLLPEIVQANKEFKAAMDFVGFTVAERQNQTIIMSGLKGIGSSIPRGAIVPGFSSGTSLPDISLHDLTEWLHRFASTEGPEALSESGERGLEFVTDQADRLFWVIAPLVAHLETGALLAGPDSSTVLQQHLSEDQVRHKLHRVLIQLGQLADLASAVQEND